MSRSIAPLLTYSAILAASLAMFVACSGTENAGGNTGGAGSALGGTSSIGGSGAAGASTHVNTGGTTGLRGTGGNAGNGGISVAGGNASTGGNGALSSCTNAPSCGSNELPVRVTSPALGLQQCGCVPNSCSGGLSACCTQVCATYYATCTGYSLDSGQMNCTQNG